MKVLLDGLSVLWQNAVPLLVFFSAACGAGYWLSRLLPGSWKQQAWLLAAFCLAAGAIPLALGALLFALLARLWTPMLYIGNISLACLAAGGLVVWVDRSRRAHTPGTQPGFGWLVGALFLLLLILRLAFIRNLALPTYSDGAEHYTMLEDLLAPAAAPQGSHLLASLAARYYHFGFHALAAWMVCVTGLSPAGAILLTGQLLPTLVFPGVLFLLGAVSTDRRLAFFGALLAAIGWKMPAYASNWSKYPASAGVMALPVVLGALYLLWRADRRRAATWLAAGMLVVGMTAFHARALICLLLALACFGVVRLLQKLLPPRFLPWLAAGVGVLLIAALTRERYLLQFYCGRQCGMLAGVALLLPFAALAAPAFTLGMFLFVLGSLGLSHLGLPEALRFYSITWLDGPFLIIFSYLPFSILGGLGIAGLLRLLERRVWLVRLITALFLGLVVWNAAVTAPVRPDHCCNFVSTDDLAALGWIAANVPPDASVVVSGYPAGASLVGMDAGMWVTPLTGKRSLPAPYGTNWDALSVLREFCKQGDLYIYISGSPVGFQKERFVRQEWYVPVFTSRAVTVIHAAACTGGK